MRAARRSIALGLVLTLTPVSLGLVTSLRYSGPPVVSIDVTGAESGISGGKTVTESLTELLPGPFLGWDTLHLARKATR